MTNHPAPSAGQIVVIHLLDSAQGHSLQTWRFNGQDEITIGRNDTSDISLSDPHVSRIHAKLVHSGGSWTLISTGRHGTLVDDHVVSEVTLQPSTVFRLGSAGPMLRFDMNSAETRRSETMDNIDGDIFSVLQIDELRTQQEVDQIAGNELFRQLKDQTQRRASTDMRQPNSLSTEGKDTV